MLKLDRKTLAQFLPNPQAIVAFEKMFSAVGGELPATIEEANVLAAQAIAAAAQALTMLAELAETLEPLATAPRQQLGSISPQNHDAVEITGGTIGIDAGTVGAPSFYLGGDRATGLYRIGADNWGLSIAGAKLADFSAAAAAFSQNVSTSKQLVSSTATGTPPLAVSSTTKVVNLYVDRAAEADHAAEATHATNADNATNAVNALHATSADTATTAATAGSAGTASALSSPNAFPADATDLPTVIALANSLKAAAVSKGL